MVGGRLTIINHKSNEGRAISPDRLIAASLYRQWLGVSLESVALDTELPDEGCSRKLGCAARTWETSLFGFVELFCEPDQEAFVSAEVAEAVRVLVLNDLANELSTMLEKPGDRLVNVSNGEHDAQISESVHRGPPVIFDRWRRDKSGKLEPVVAVRGDHHSDLNALGP